ncbi:aminopeptidase N [Pseudoalteromonas ulvae UL12]|uniref:aminopeptidase N n=1 Tax=Pseudoalteromonas ulvae TaxID=107327 RepID=UPI00186B7359|nr:aminopeptidase N [Pseudoalteromonas ulvae]MBE0363892.1 aminopeptidase N [Pseudoalteromonas ulvae UL12]
MAAQAKYLKDYQPVDFTIDDISLTFDLFEQSTRVVAVSKVTRLNSSATQFVLDGVELTLVEVKINGQKTESYQCHAETMTLNVDEDSFELMIITEINPLKNTSLEGLYLSGGAYCTQCEAEGFRKITYFPDRPDVLATYEVKVIADRSFPFLLSNGNKVEEGELADGRHFTVWKDPYKKPCYLFALVAGDFDVLKDTFITQSGRTVELALFVDKGNLDKSEHAMTSLKQAMKWDEEVYGLEYDLDIYMIVAVDFFNMGAMENKGLNIFNSKCVLANQETATDKDYHTIESIIGHEYFHNWTGNRVTCRDWFQLSLKEGLTVFRDQEFSADLGSRALNRIAAVKVMRTHQFAEDSGPMSHPIRPEKVIEMNNFYTVTVYDKGAEVIRMIHTLLGKNGFRAGMDLYFARHDGQAVTCNDFVNAMSDASGVDLTQFKRWYSQSGTPELSVVDHYDATTATYHLTVKQHHPLTADQASKQNLHIPFAIQLLDEHGKVFALQNNGQAISNILNLTDSEHTFVFEDILQTPTPVLLEDFSAPCLLNYDYQTSQLITIVKHAHSEFSRWDAQQTLFTQLIKGAVLTKPNKLLSADVVQLIQDIIVDEKIEKELKAELLKLPTFETIAAQFKTVPIDDILLIVEQFESEIASEFSESFIALYRQQADHGAISAEAVGQRAIKSVCLYYIAKVDVSEGNELLINQFKSNNMTDVLAVLHAAVVSSHSLMHSFLSQFEQKWQKDVLVMDKWLAVNALIKQGDVIKHIQQLYQHPCFDIANPNRVRALVNSFTFFNTAFFHAKDGSGYQLLTDLLIQLNEINPQNASRLITPLMGWKRLDTVRQELIQSQLKRLVSLPNLSPDLYEKVVNALK